MSGTLYLVATPIGNLSDISDRCRDTLEAVDFIAAEDTRVTIKLLNHLEIKKPLVSYYEHNTRQSGQRILSRILAGESCALVTDAGMPAISDPGEQIVELCAQNGVEVSVIPGPCALVSALAVSGLPTGRFTFEGFLSMNNKSRREHLAQLRGEQRTMVFYEAPHKLKKTLADMLAVFGDRDIAMCREMTKLHEQVLRMKLSEAIKLYEETAPRGEYVLVVRGAVIEKMEAGIDEAMSLTEERIRNGESLKDAVKAVAKLLNMPKNELYAAAVKKENIIDSE